MSRYRVEGDWVVVETLPVIDYQERHTSAIIIEVADLRDTKDNHLYQDGARRVRVEGDVTPKPRTRSFHGEMAYHGARSYKDECVTEIHQTYQKMTFAEGLR